MSYPLDNLGDYNKVRDALHAVGGNANVFYAQIEQNAAPKYVGAGINPHPAHAHIDTAKE